MFPEMCVCSQSGSGGPPRSDFSLWRPAFRLCYAPNKSATCCSSQTMLSQSCKTPTLRVRSRIPMGLSKFSPPFRSISSVSQTHHRQDLNSSTQNKNLATWIRSCGSSRTKFLNANSAIRAQIRSHPQFSSSVLATTNSAGTSYHSIS